MVSIKNHRNRESFLVTKNYHPERNTIFFFFFLAFNSLLLCLLFAATCQKPEKEAIPGDLLKWGSLGFCRTSRFASGFKPLEPKPLDSIMDLNRAKNRSPEDLASIWDDYHLGRGHIGLTMKAKLYRLLEQRGSAGILSFLCGEEVVIQQCLLKCNCHTCFS